MKSSEYMNSYSYEFLRIDPAAETERLTAFINETVTKKLRKQGVVVGLSGGLDSSVTAALSVRSLGPDRVIGLLMPEKDSHPDTLKLSQMVGESLGIRTIHRDITPILTGLGFYQEISACLQEMIPEYSDGWKWKISASELSADRVFTFFWLVVQSPSGEMIRRRIPADKLLQIIALSNFKQRTRKMLEYHYADRFNYAVAGTSNLLEADQGFFVKLGDGAGDFKPIVHLYKSQVHQLGEYLGLPEAITGRQPTADIHPLAQGQDEFFYGLPYQQLDACLYGEKHNLPPEKIAELTGLLPEQVSLVYRQIKHRRASTEYLRMGPLSLA
ncbi:MAG: NAD(+) synthase [Candidatus Saccharicenans sp.]